MDGSPSRHLTLTNGADGSPIGFAVRRIVLAGYTGRDRATVQRHVDELREQGVPAPSQTPELYRIENGAIQIGGSLKRAGGWSSGEVEFVLLVAPEMTYVGVGSDHTDRDRERASMIEAKRAYPKILGSVVWPLEALLPDWDGLTLRSWVSGAGERRLYQEGSVASIMAPQDLLALLERDERGPGLALYSGTLPALELAPERGRCLFEGAIVTPRGQALITCEYTYEA